MGGSTVYVEPYYRDQRIKSQIFRGRGLFTRFLVLFVQRLTSVRLDIDFANASVNIREQ